jgi:hypothetical protein
MIMLHKVGEYMDGSVVLEMWCNMKKKKKKSFGLIVKSSNFYFVFVNLIWFDVHFFLMKDQIFVDSSCQMHLLKFPITMK